MTRLDHEVGVITSEKISCVENSNFTVFRLSKPFISKVLNLNFLEIPQITKSWHPDIFHINYQTGGENLLILWLTFMKIPFVITYHADHVVTLGRMIDELQLASTFKCAKMIMVQSERDWQKFHKRGIVEDKLRLIRFNGIDTTKYKCSFKDDFNKEKINLLCIARLDDFHKYKGVRELIEGFKTLKKKKLSFGLSLHIVGDGNLREFYEKYCKKYQLDNIKFLGELSFDDLLRQICNANFLILPSVDNGEGFGRVVLEALSCGTPVIVSKYAGISELIIKYNAGIIYEPEQFENLIVKLELLLKNSEQVQYFVDNGKRMILEEELSLQSTTQKVIDIYDECL